MAYPMMPVVNPDRITALFLRAPATTGTKGGEQMAEVEVMIKVSVSMFLSFRKIISF